MKGNRNQPHVWPKALGKHRSPRAKHGNEAVQRWLLELFLPTSLFADRALSLELISTAPPGGTLGLLNRASQREVQAP